MEPLPTGIRPGEFLASASTKFISPSSFVPINRATGTQLKPRVPGGNVWGIDAGSNVVSTSFIPTTLVWNFSYVGQIGTLPTFPSLPLPQPPFKYVVMNLSNFVWTSPIVITFNRSSNPSYDITAHSPVLEIQTINRNPSFTITANTITILPVNGVAPASSNYLVKLTLSDTTFNLPLTSITHRAPVVWDWQPSTYNFASPTVYPALPNNGPFYSIAMYLTGFSSPYPIIVTFNVPNGYNMSSVFTGYPVVITSATVKSASIGTNTVTIIPQNTITTSSILTVAPYQPVYDYPNTFNYPVLSITQAQPQTWTWTPTYDFATPNAYPARPINGPFRTVNPKLKGFGAPRQITITFSITDNYFLSAKMITINIVSNIQPGSLILGNDTVRFTPIVGINPAAIIEFTMSETSAIYPSLFNYSIASITQLPPESWTITYDFVNGVIPTLPNNGPFGALYIRLTNFTTTNRITVTFDTSTNPSYNMAADLPISIPAYNVQVSSIIIGTNTVSFIPTVLGALSSVDILAQSIVYQNVFNYPILSITQANTPPAATWTWAPTYDYVSTPASFPALPNTGPFGKVNMKLKGFVPTKTVEVTFDTSSNPNYDLSTAAVADVSGRANINSSVTLSKDSVTFSPLSTITASSELIVPFSDASSVFNYPILAIAQDSPVWKWSPAYDYRNGQTYPALPNNGPFGSVRPYLTGFSSTNRIFVTLLTAPTYDLSTDMTVVKGIRNIDNTSILIGQDNFSFIPAPTINTTSILELFLAQAPGTTVHIFNEIIGNIFQPQGTAWDFTYNASSSGIYPTPSIVGPFNSLIMNLVGFSSVTNNGNSTAPRVTVTFDTALSIGYSLSGDMPFNIPFKNITSGSVIIGSNTASFIPSSSITISSVMTLITQQSPGNAAIFNFPILSILQDQAPWVIIYDKAYQAIPPIPSANPYYAIWPTLTGFTTLDPITILFDSQSNPSYNLSTDLTQLTLVKNIDPASFFFGSNYIIFRPIAPLSSSTVMSFLLSIPAFNDVPTFNLPLLSITQGAVWTWSQFDYQALGIVFPNPNGPYSTVYANLTGFVPSRTITIVFDTAIFGPTMASLVFDLTLSVGVDINTPITTSSNSISFKTDSAITVSSTIILVFLDPSNSFNYPILSITQSVNM
jgi:hypothetical protein